MAKRQSERFSRRNRGKGSLNKGQGHSIENEKSGGFFKKIGNFLRAPTPAYKAPSFGKTLAYGLALTVLGYAVKLSQADFKKDKKKDKVENISSTVDAKEPVFTKQAQTEQVTKKSSSSYKANTKKTTPTKTTPVKTVTPTKTDKEKTPELDVFQDAKLFMLGQEKARLEAEKAGLLEARDYHQSQLDNLIEQATPYWELEAYLDFVRQNRRQGGNLRINTRGPMFTARNLIYDTRVADMRDEQKIFAAIALASDYTTLKDNLPLRKRALKVGKRLSADYDALNKMEEAQFARLEKRQEELNEDVYEQRRKGYRISRRQRSRQREINQAYRNMDIRRNDYTNNKVHGNIQFFADLHDYALDQLMNKYEPAIVEHETILNGYRDRRRGIEEIGLNEQIKDVEKLIKGKDREIRNRKRELRRQGKKVSAVTPIDMDMQETLHDLLGVSQDKNQAVAQNNIEQDYQENTLQVVGHLGQAKGQDFHLKKVITLDS